MTSATPTGSAPLPRSGQAAQTHPQDSRRWCRRRHFTIAEVVCVFGLMGVTFAALAALLSFNIWLRDNLNRQLVATNVAKSRLERLRVAHFADLPRFDEREVQVNGDGAADPKGGYFRLTTVGGEYARSRPVTVTVRCPGRLGKPGFQTSLSTVVTNSSTTE